jgi:hypothetical protein
MSYPINYPTPQGANVQIFYAPTIGGSNSLASWTKPQGASFVWFTLIGGGGTGDNTTGGGSGAVTNFMCPAFLIPDNLSVKVAYNTSVDTIISYRQKTGAGYTLLQANGTGGTAAAIANAANAFTAMGFFQSVAGHNGSSTSISAPPLTFLSGGGAVGGTQVSNYGYSTGAASTSRNGFFQMQPIIVGAGGMGSGIGGLGCGGSANNSGGNGMVVIITW